MKFPKTTFKKLILAAILLSLLFGTAAVFATENCKMNAAQTKEPQIAWPAAPIGGYTLDETSTIPDLVGYLFGWGVGLGGLAVFIALIIAGIQLITSVADPGKMNEAKARIKSAVIGLALLLSSWAIFQLINPNLTTLQDISKLKGDISKFGIATRIECKDVSDCCKIPGCIPANDCDNPSDPNCCYDFSCRLENFACCPFNDIGCMQGKISSLKTGTIADEAGCKMDRGCQSGYCKCDRSVIPWEQKCEPNPNVCINILGEPNLGCDYIGFYPSPDFDGTAEYVEVTHADSGWVNITNMTGIADIRSYQAYKAVRNPKNKNEYYDENGKITRDKNLAKKVPCGETGCGCKVSVCNDPGTTWGSCVNIKDYGLAFNPNMDGSDREVARIYDDSKSRINQAKKIPGDITNFIRRIF